MYSGGLWRAISADAELNPNDRFCWHSPPNLLAKSWWDFRDKVRNASLYLEQERKRLQWLKISIEKRVNKHVGRSSLYLNVQSSATVFRPNRQQEQELFSVEKSRHWRHRPLKKMTEVQSSQDNEQQHDEVNKSEMTAVAPVPETNGHLVVVNGSVGGDLSVKKSMAALRLNKESPMLNNNNNTNSKQFRLNGSLLDEINKEDLVLDENGSPVSGTLTAFIKRLMPRKDYYPDKSYIFTFLLNARIFMSPNDLLQELLDYCIREQTPVIETFKKESKRKFFSNVVTLLAEWTETFPYDFCQSQIKTKLKEILDICCTNDPTVRTYRTNIMQSLNNKLSKLERYENALTELHRETGGSVWPSEIFTGIIEKNSSPPVVAQQLTHIELERLSMIGAEEFVYAYAKECSSKDTTAFLLNHSSKGRTAKNIEHYIEWCNRLSFLVATEICRHLKKKHRVKIIEFFIDVAKECFNMGNFNSLVAIAGAIDMNPVRRLRKTWSKINTSKWKILEHQTDPGGNFLSYRSTLKAAVWRSEGAKKPCEKIVIPAFSILFRDLLSFYEQCKIPLSNGHLNFAVFSEFAQHLRTFMQWKDVECPFEKNEDLLQYILTSPVYNEKSLQLASYECEPPESASEKEVHKRLRLEVQFSYSNDACDAYNSSAQVQT